VVTRANAMSLQGCGYTFRPSPHLLIAPVIIVGDHQRALRMKRRRPVKHLVERLGLPDREMLPQGLLPFSDRSRVRSRGATIEGPFLGAIRWWSHDLFNLFLAVFLCLL
jgi:hypothetical protein